MHLEHLIYSIAIAIIAGGIYLKYANKDYSWIIIASAYAPDLDLFLETLSGIFGIALLIHGKPITHGDFHNLAAMLLFAVIIALLLQRFKIRFRDSFIFAFIGFGAHLVEDALVYNPAYAFFWPISDQKYGIGLFDYSRDLYGIADPEVLIVGLMTVVVLATIRMRYEGNEWITNMVVPNYLLIFYVKIRNQTHLWVKRLNNEYKIVGSKSKIINNEIADR